MRYALRVVLGLVVLTSATEALAQTPKSTGQNYFGFDVGATYSWFVGQSNFVWPMRQLFDNSNQGNYTIASYASFDGLGSGPGIELGLKAALAMSQPIDLEAKIRYLTNYSRATENQTLQVSAGNTTKAEPVINSYGLFLDYFDFDILTHIAASAAWYGAGGFSVSTLFSNHITAEQTQNGGDDWTYNKENTQESTGFKTISVDGRLDNFFASTRIGLLIGGGRVFSINTTLLDAELLLSIPLTRLLQDSGASAVKSWSNIAGHSSITFPKSWYASFTIGIRFPFGGNDYTEQTPSYTGTVLKLPKPQIVTDNILSLAGTITDSKDSLTIKGATITVVNLTSGRIIATTKSDQTGRYSVHVGPAGKYSITADKDGYLFGSAYFEVDEKGRSISRHLDIKLNKVSNGRTRLLVFFEFNSVELIAMSYPELDRIVKLLKRTPTMKVEIAGYTDSVGSVEFNKYLSERRANAVRDYLVKNGIPKDHVAAKGYGEESPIVDNGTDDGRAENRRVEFVVLSK